jgi:hypothetical protein
MNLGNHLIFVVGYRCPGQQQNDDNKFDYISIGGGHL